MSRNAGVAQLVEHLIRNEGVVGSSPITGTTKSCLPKRYYCVFLLPLYITQKERGAKCLNVQK